MNDNDYLKFFNQPQNYDFRQELKNMLLTPKREISLESSKEMPELALETFNYNYSSQERESEGSYDPFTDNIEGNMLTTFIVKDTSQASLTERDPEIVENNLTKENQMLKAKVAFQNKVILILKKKASDVNIVKELRAQLKSITEENGYSQN